MPQYEVTIGNLPRNEDALARFPQEMSEFMHTNGFTPKVVGDLTVWRGEHHFTTDEKLLEAMMQERWEKDLGYPVTVTVVKLEG